MIRIKGWGSTSAVILIYHLPLLIEVGTCLGLDVCIYDFRGWPGFRTGSRTNGDALLMYQFMQNTIS